MIEDMMSLLKNEKELEAITLEDAIPGTEVLEYICGRYSRYRGNWVHYIVEDAIPGTEVIEYIGRRYS